MSTLWLLSGLWEAELPKSLVSSLDHYINSIHQVLGGQMEILLGFMVAAWLFTLGAVSYALWRYCFAPWKVMRVDIKSMDQKVELVKADFKALEQAVRPARMQAFSDTELASIEARARAGKR